MRHFFSIGGGIAAPVLVLVVMMTVACNSSKTVQDADTVTPDGDTASADDVINLDQDKISPTDDQSDISNDSDTVESDPLITDDDGVMADTDTSDLDTAETDVVDQENDPGSDADDDDAIYCVVDENPDADIVYIPNTHTGNELCPDLSSAEFPYYDTDGTIHFCRQCDEVRENDPQCVRNLWLDANEQLCTEKPQYDCGDYPCEMPWLRPTEPGEQPAPLVAPMHECDLQLNPQNPNGWLTGIATFKHFNLSDNHIGFSMNNIYANNTTYFSSWRAFEYGISVQQYLSLGVVSGDMYGYYRKNSLFTTSSAGARTTRYLVYVSDNKNYRVVYNEPIRIVTYTPALNETWAFANINDGLTDHMMYAKIGEWQWTNLGDDTANEPYLVGDRLVFYDSNFRGIVCDLSLSPQSIDDCLIINRDQEDIRFPVPDEQNNNYIYFENTTVRDRIYKVDLGKDPWEYTELPLQEVEPTTYQIPILQVRGDILLYRNNFKIDLPYEYDSKLCYYRVSEKKSYCMKPMDRYNNGDLLPIKYSYGYAEFDTNHLVWQAWNDYATYYRDMDCYCEKEGVCPFATLKKKVSAIKGRGK